MTAPPTDTPALPDGVEFVGTLPPVRTKTADLRAALEARPGEWARVAAGVTRGQATGRASAINGGVGAWDPAGRWEASIRQEGAEKVWSVYARLVVPAEATS